ncbi:MAG: TonB family protein [Thermoanaerobaculum sp.]
MGWFADRRFRLGLELSLLLHLLLLLLPDRLTPVNPVAAKPVVPAQKDEPPLRFELVELPNQKEEQPSRPDAPGSDLSRRAHGGSGEKAERPGVSGTSPELRVAPPSPSLRQNPSSPSSPTQRSSPSGNPTESQGKRNPLEEANEEGLGIFAKPKGLPLPQPAPREPQPALRGLSPFSSPSLGVLPDRQGGQVDLGPLSFDTQWYDWGPYAAEMLQRIRYHWRIPELAQLGVPGVVRIRFFIEKDGRVTGLTILKDSSHPPMDFAARDAILNASPLPPLPKEVGVEREGVIITFYYNVRPPEDS